MYASPHIGEEDILRFTPTVDFLQIKYVVQNYNPINMQLKLREKYHQVRHFMVFHVLLCNKKQKI